MIKAILKGGIIRHVSPLPASWSDGQELVVGTASETLEVNETMAVGDEMEDIAPEDQIRLLATLHEQRRAQKDLERREMGIS